MRVLSSSFLAALAVLLRASPAVSDDAPSPCDNFCPTIGGVISTYLTSPMIEFSSGNDSVTCGSLQNLIDTGLFPESFCEENLFDIQATCCFPPVVPTNNPTPMPTLPPVPTFEPTPRPTPIPTLAPTPFPTPFPTRAPRDPRTPIPTLPPTPVPTVPPTDPPTPIPTTLSPTPRPTPRPTPDPTPLPTPNPTPDPTPLPTGPSAAPTPVPTVSPTPVPTDPPVLTLAPVTPFLTNVPTASSNTFSLPPNSNRDADELSGGASSSWKTAFLMGGMIWSLFVFWG